MYRTIFINKIKLITMIIIIISITGCYETDYKKDYNINNDRTSIYSRFLYITYHWTLKLCSEITYPFFADTSVPKTGTKETEISNDCNSMNVSINGESCVVTTCTTVTNVKKYRIFDVYEQGELSNLFSGDCRSVLLSDEDVTETNTSTSCCDPRPCQSNSCSWVQCCGTQCQ